MVKAAAADVVVKAVADITAIEIAIAIVQVTVMDNSAAAIAKATVAIEKVVATAMIKGRFELELD